MAACSFIPNLCLPKLGTGAGILTFGFRACAHGFGEDPRTIESFREALPKDGPEILLHLNSFSKSLSRQGRRRIGVASPACGHITADELSLVAAFARAQEDHGFAQEAHLTWILAAPPSTGLMNHMRDITDLFLCSGLNISCPVFSAVHHPAQTAQLVVKSGGKVAHA
ncbi:MAG: hypothetical protein AAF603_08190 [Pseudomonadota bacterium]